MLADNALAGILITLFDRRPFAGKAADRRPLRELCLALLSETAELSGRQLAATILDRYAALAPADKLDFFAFLNDELDVDAERIGQAAAAYAADPSPQNYRALAQAGEPPRQALFRKLNEAAGATAGIVRLRADLLQALRAHPELARTDHDLVHLLRSWFNRGFLVTRQIDWDSPASILEKIIAYEAVHQIDNWDDLRRRLQPEDRRCFAFFHPSMPDEPLIFVEIALTNGIPVSIQSVLSEEREVIHQDQADTAVFYSISNCQKGLAGVSFGSSLIKQVVRDLSARLPGLRSFVTLSPMPGLMDWVREQGLEAKAGDPAEMKRLAARYLLEAKAEDGLPRDPVARFHLGNGAVVHAIHAGADTSAAGMARSGGVMVNYLYDLARIAPNTIGFSKGKVAASPAVRSLSRRAA